jgi:hypothetical protein
MDIARVDQLRRHLREYPEYHDQKSFVCDTTACAAGWTVALEHQAQAGTFLRPIIRGIDVFHEFEQYKEKWNFCYCGNEECESSENIAGYARMLLDLTKEDARALFYSTADFNDSGVAETDALALLDAFINREKGELTKEDISILERYELSCETPEGDS